MTMIYNESQQMLEEMARGFFAEKAGVATLRSLRDADDAIGFDQDVWRNMAELGFAGILLPEAAGGMALGHIESGIVAEAIGRNLSPCPYNATAIGAAIALGGASTPFLRERVAQIAQGEAIATVAVDEGNVHAPAAIALEAAVVGGKLALTGIKSIVPHGHSADLLIVAARPSDGEGVLLCLVEQATPGLTAAPTRHIDSGLYANLLFEGVEVSEEQVIATGAEGAALLDRMLDAMRLGVAAELVGIARELFERTMSYLRERQQFGVVVGSFQALQHRAAHLYAEIEVARGAVLKAQSLMDAGDPGASAAVSVAKAFADMAATLAAQEGVQLHGGIGMTDELDIGLFMKRAKMLGQLYGGADFHAGRIANLNGY